MKLGWLVHIRGDSAIIFDGKKLKVASFLSKIAELVLRELEVILSLKLGLSNRV